MFYQIYEPIRYFWKALTADRLPRDIALGIALGMMVGLIPKGNLTAALLALVMASLRLNLGASLLTALAVSALSPRIDQLTHGIGLRILDLEITERLLVRWYDLPLVPWLSLNNTVVLGNLLLGMVLFYPTYHVSRSTAVQLSPLVARLRGRSSGEEQDAGERSEPTSAVMMQSARTQSARTQTVSDAMPPATTARREVPGDRVSEITAAAANAPRHTSTMPLREASPKTPVDGESVTPPRFAPAPSSAGGAPTPPVGMPPREVMGLQELLAAIDANDAIQRKPSAPLRRPTSAVVAPGPDDSQPLGGTDSTFRQEPIATDESPTEAEPRQPLFVRRAG